MTKTITEPLILYIEHLASPIGTVVLLTDHGERVRALDFADHEQRMLRLLRLHYGTSYQMMVRRSQSVAARAVKAYFAGDLGALDVLESHTNGTEFQRAVWRALRDIQPARTISYTELAAAIGRPKAVRAVGMANGANPVGIIVPCHRVIGSNGSLTGYGGGLPRKQWLLAHESS